VVSIEYEPNKFAKFTMEYGVADLSIFSEYRREEGLYWTEKELRKLFYQLYSQMKTLRQRRIFHRDIKPHNIIVFCGDKIVKITDYSHAEILNGTSDVAEVTACGTRAFWTPQMEKAYDSSTGKIKTNLWHSDIYSLIQTIEDIVDWMPKERLAEVKNFMDTLKKIKENILNNLDNMTDDDVLDESIFSQNDKENLSEWKKHNQKLHNFHMIQILAMSSKAEIDNHIKNLIDYQILPECEHCLKEELNKILKENLHKEHLIRKAFLLSFLARLHYHQGRYKIAVKEYEEVRSIKSQCADLAQESGFILSSSYYDIGLIHYLMGNYALSNDNFKIYIEYSIKEAIPDSTTYKYLKLIQEGLEHLSSLRSHYTLSILYENAGFPSSAQDSLDGYFKAIDLLFKLLEAMHNDLESTEITEELRDSCIKALTCFIWALQIQLDDPSIGEYHSEVAHTHFGIGCIHYILGDYAKTRYHFKKTLEIRQAVFGQNGKSHPYIAIAQNNVRVIYFKMGKFRKARKYYWRAYDTLISCYGKKSLCIAHSYNSIGSTLVKENKSQIAMIFFRRACSIINEISGSIHLDITATFINIAGVLSENGQHEQALKYYEDALKIRIDATGSNHFEVSNLYKKIGMEYSHLGKEKEAMTKFSHALDILTTCDAYPALIQENKKIILNSLLC